MSRGEKGGCEGGGAVLVLQMRLSTSRSSWKNSAAAGRLNVDGAPGRHHTHSFTRVERNQQGRVSDSKFALRSRLCFKVRAEDREMMQNPHLSHDSNKSLLPLPYLCFLDKSPRLSLWTPCACMSLTCVSAVVGFGLCAVPGSDCRHFLSDRLNDRFITYQLNLLYKET